jgi:CRP-like cAMP-binding protein
MSLAALASASDSSVSAPINTAASTEVLKALLEVPFRPVRFPRAAVIYRPGEPAESVFLISEGRVKLTRVAENGRESVLDIFRTGELFGELAVLGASNRREQATTLDDVTAGVCPAPEFRQRLDADAGLAGWFAQMLGKRLEDAYDRVQTLSFDSIPVRLVRVILRNANRFGSELEDGRIRVQPLTHEALAQQVATSREIVTHYMNDFRDKGLLEYSRKSIDIAPKRLAEILEIKD